MLVRKSGTELKIRIMGESENRILLQKCINTVRRTKYWGCYVTLGNANSMAASPTIVTELT